MGRKPNTARFPLAGSGAPEVQVLRYTTGQTFTEYALVTETAAGEISECGADPTAVLGLSLGGAGKGPGYGMANSAETVFVTGRNQEVPVAIFNRNTVFSIRGVNGATDPVVPIQTHIDEQYGVVKTAGGDWVLDFAEVTTKVFEIVDIDVDLNMFLVKPLEIVLQRP
jgi:hypothetical protein